MIKMIEAIRARRKRANFCPTGFQEVDLGLYTFYVGRDSSDPGKMVYEHYSNCEVISMLGFPPGRRWKSVESFKVQVTKALRRLLVEAIQVLDTEVLE